MLKNLARRYANDSQLPYILRGQYCGKGSCSEFHWLFFVHGLDCGGHWSATHWARRQGGTSRISWWESTTRFSPLTLAISEQKMLFSSIYFHWDLFAIIHTRFQTFRLKQLKKTTPFGAAHSYIAYIIRWVPFQPLPLPPSCPSRATGSSFKIKEMWSCCHSLQSSRWFLNELNRFRD